MSALRVLFIRLNAIGDIVLTTPIVRSLKQQRPEIEIHYLTRDCFREILAANPYIDQLHTVKKNATEAIARMKALNFDLVLDLHNNLKSFYLRNALPAPARRVPKRNYSKLAITHLKQRWLRLPHIVRRYARVLRAIPGCQLDDGGLDFFIPDAARRRVHARFAESFGGERPLAIGIGAKHATKIWPAEHYAQLVQQIEGPVVLLGGPDDHERADTIIRGQSRPQRVFNGIGEFSLVESAAAIELSRFVISHDSGLMHIAAALQKKLVTIWGNTVPAFGMTPYQSEHIILENNALLCRPCDKIGHPACPLGHHKCMRDIEVSSVLQAVREIEAALTPQDRVLQPFIDASLSAPITAVSRTTSH